MPADNHIMEALARIEHKLDLLLVLDAMRNGQIGLPRVGTETNCPLCKEPVSYTVDVTEGVVLRKCGCKTGKIALNLGAFAPPASKKKEQEDEQQRSTEEDRRDPSGRGGSKRR